MTENRAELLTSPIFGARSGSAAPSLAGLPGQWRPARRSGRGATRSRGWPRRRRGSASDNCAVPDAPHCKVAWVGGMEAPTEDWSQLVACGRVEDAH